MNSRTTELRFSLGRVSVLAWALAGAACTPPTPESTAVGLSAPGTNGNPASSAGDSSSPAGSALDPGDSTESDDSQSGAAATNGSASVGAEGPGAEGLPSVGGLAAGDNAAGDGPDAGSAVSPGSPGSQGTGCWATGADGKVQLDPTGKIVLFDGTNMAEWHRETGGPSHWALLPDGTMEVVPAEPPTDLQSNQLFEDLCVHVEYLTPTYPSNVLGQLRGNSGVYLKSAYEMQILDSRGQPPAIDSCGAVYSIQPPLAVACNQELVWNTYEIEFAASEWSGDMKTKDASFVLVTLNGIVVQRNVPMNPNGGFTQAGNPDRPGPQPLMLQDHRNRIKFRNIWVKVPHA